MTRAQQHISVAALLSSIYLACLMGFVPFPAKIQQDIIPILPFWALVSFGAFLLFKLGYGVLTFNDVPDAHKELMQQIEQARSDLKAKGVEVD